MSKFVETMSELGYVLESQEEKKITYKKRARFSELYLILDLEQKYINPVLVPISLVIRSSDLVNMYEEFKLVRKDAKEIRKLSGYTYEVLN